jgi:hypothetical protein
MAQKIGFLVVWRQAQDDGGRFHCDNQSCIKLTENPVFHDRSKHIDMRYHYIRDLVQRKTVKLQYIVTSKQVVDILTKPLTSRQFVQLRCKLGVAKNDSLVEREC